MNPNTLISLAGGVISNPLRRLAAPASFELREGESIAIVGPNGSGKSTLLEMIRGGFFLREGTLRLNLDDEPYRAIRVVKFDNAYSTSETQYYYQQRWQAFERDAAPKAGELLLPAAGDQTADIQNINTIACAQNKYEQFAQTRENQPNTLQGSNPGDWRELLFDLLNIRPLLDKEIITLSSGELRRFSIARALMERPQVLILESPFIGLDPPTRQTLCDLMEQLATQLGISFIMTLTAADQIPPVVTHVYFMEGGQISDKVSARWARRIGQDGQPNIRSGEEYASEGCASHTTDRCEAILPHSVHEHTSECTQAADGGLCDFRVRHDILIGQRLSQPDSAITCSQPMVLAQLHGTPQFDIVVQMKNVNISYGERHLFKDLNWTVRSGEKWNVTGANGSGKSTLLSLVNADNPRAYSLDITLFDHRRGTGESIWDIKRHIGFLSSEMHSSFITSDTVLEIIRGGLDDGYREAFTLHTQISEDDYLMHWLELFGAEDLAQRRYNTLSSGEQRYILLIRAFVKDPDLLILDEPFQGLDPGRRHRAGAVIESFCAQENKTLIFVTHYIEEIPGVVTHTLQL